MRDLLPFKHLVETVVKTMNFGRVDSTTFQTTVWEDNAGALTLANLDPGRMTPRSKHYAVKYHWFRSHLKPNNIKVMKIETSQQKADILTKGLRATKFIENSQAPLWMVNKIKKKFFYLHLYIYILTTAIWVALSMSLHSRGSEKEQMVHTGLRARTCECDGILSR
jgi:hypothetical protein